MVAGATVRYWVGSLCLLAAIGGESAQAQFVRGRIGIGGGIGVRVPYAPRIVVGVRPVAPLVRSYVPFVAPRRIIAAPLYRAPAYVPAVRGAVAAVPNYAGSQVYASQYTEPAPSAVAPVEAAAPASSEPAFPTEAELQAMDDGALLNALVGVTGQLDADLGRFNTGAKWQTYLRLPSDALPPPTNNQVRLGMESLKTTLGRFDKIASDSAYQSISNLPSFVASRAALAETVERFGSRQAPPPIPPQTPPQSSGAGAASVQEELPAPGLAPAPSAGEQSTGEKSILTR